MSPAIKKTFAVIVAAISFTWLGIVQLLFWTAPIAIASEAPDRIYPNKKEFTKEETYHLSFSLAREIQNRIPDIWIPAILLFLSSKMYFSATHQKSRNTAEQGAAANP